MVMGTQENKWNPIRTMPSLILVNVMDEFKQVTTALKVEKKIYIQTQINIRFGKIKKME